ncbi:MAG: DUF349 domain-containing protein [Mycobacteriales bacterium]
MTANETATQQQAAQWGRVAEDGTVYVRTPDGGEREVGSWQAGDAAEALSYFARKYDDLVTEVELLEQRLAAHTGDTSSLKHTAERVRDTLPNAAVVGDLAALEKRTSAVLELIEQRRTEEKAARAAAAAEATTRKQELVAEAEALAESTEWKKAGDRLKEILTGWKEIRGVDRKTDHELWRRLIAARDTFAKRRGTHFAALDEQRKAAAGRKEELVLEAEALADSTDWGPTAARFKQLMRDWKAAGRANKEAEERLWQRFRAAQDQFFTARSSVFAERDEKYRENQHRKEELLSQLEAMDPEADLDGVRARLADVQRQWDEIGRVPRDAMNALEARLSRAVQRVREAADARWRGTGAGTLAGNAMVTQLRESVRKLEEQAAAARAAGKESDARRAEEAAELRRAWLAQAEQTAADQRR